MSVNAMYTALSGLTSFGTALSVVSDNIANSNTTAFKSGTVEFRGPRQRLHGDHFRRYQGSGVGNLHYGHQTDWGGGGSIQTGNWSDVMMQGNGYFSVEDPNNATTQYYTRDGSFKVDASGDLTDMHGYQVLGVDGKPIQVEKDPTNPVYSSYSIDKSGNVWGTASGGQTKIGTLLLSTFPNQEGLIRQGQDLYIAGATAGTANTNNGGNTALIGRGGIGLSRRVERGPGKRNGKHDHLPVRLPGEFKINHHGRQPDSDGAGSREVAAHGSTCAKKAALGRLFLF